MSEKQDWRERWERKDRDGATVVDVAAWADGSAAVYRYREPSGYEGSTSFVDQLIPRKPAPVVVPWEPGEVPVGAVVRSKTSNSHYSIITQREDDLFYVEGCRFCSVGELFDLFVLHQPGAPTSDCQPCGKVVGS